MKRFAFKKKETIFDNITYKPAVTQMLKTFLEHDFQDAKILIISDFLVPFC